MFGHQDDQQELHDQAVVAQPVPDHDWANNQPHNDNSNHDDQGGPGDNSLSGDDQSDHAVTSSDSSNLSPSATPAPLALPASDDLLDIKQQALSQLSPIVKNLDQSPEERFRTTMMMIQASDDQTLIKQAYESAQDITDEKKRAQALLDIVNEINYFTQPHKD